MKSLVMALVAVIFLGPLPANSENSFSGPLYGHLWVLQPATSWQYQDLGTFNLKELDLYSWSGWYSQFQTWKVWSAPTGQKYLFRVNGLYIDLAIPLPSGL